MHTFFLSFTFECEVRACAGKVCACACERSVIRFFFRLLLSSRGGDNDCVSFYRCTHFRATIQMRSEICVCVLSSRIHIHVAVLFSFHFVPSIISSTNCLPYLIDTRFRFMYYSGADKFSENVIRNAVNHTNVLLSIAQSIARFRERELKRDNWRLQSQKKSHNRTVPLNKCYLCSFLSIF